MPKCLDCGNIYKFSRSTICSDMYYYNEAGESYDSKSLWVDADPNTADMCGECNSTNIEGEL